MCKREIEKRLGRATCVRAHQHHAAGSTHCLLLAQLIACAAGSTHCLRPSMLHRLDTSSISRYSLHLYASFQPISTPFRALAPTCLSSTPYSQAHSSLLKCLHVSMQGKQDVLAQVKNLVLVQVQKVFVVRSRGRRRIQTREGKCGMTPPDKTT